MTTPHRTLLQQALDALDRAISDDRAYIRECKDAAEAIRAHLAAQPAPAEDFCYCDDDISLQMVSGGAALEGLYGRVTLKINGQYVDYVKAQPAPAEPVALESVHLTRDIKGMCTVRVNGRVAIQDNGDIIDHMATLEWFAQPAPVPPGYKLALVEPTDDMVQAAAEAWDAAPGLYAAFAAALRAGIAASPEQPK